MVKIVITNHNLDSTPCQLTFDSQTNIVTNEKGDTLEKSTLFKKNSSFYHPLLTCEPLDVKNNLVTVSYSHCHELFDNMIRVYSTILQSPEPDLLIFDFTPSAQYQTKDPQNTLFFSIFPHKHARSCISIKQLNNIMNAIYSHSFNYTDHVIIQGKIPVHSLPEFVNADSLYQADETIYNYLNQSADNSHLEIRFISANIGFGVFCRNKIRQDQIVGLYAGKKDLRKNCKSRFRFGEVDDLNLMNDAKHHGNITRFINHATKRSKIPDQETANLVAVGHKLHGINFTIFYASRDIKQGEQLLFQYHEQAFDKELEYYIKGKYKLYNYKNQRLPKHPADKVALNIFAKNNIEQAKRRFLIKPSLFLLLSIIILVIIDYFF